MQHLGEINTFPRFRGYIPPDSLLKTKSPVKPAQAEKHLIKTKEIPRTPVNEVWRSPQIIP